MKASRNWRHLRKETATTLKRIQFVLRNFREQEEIAISMFLLQDETTDHFRILAYITLLYSLMALFVVAGIVPDTYPYDAAVLTLFGGMAYFLKGIRDVTSGAEE